MRQRTASAGKWAGSVTQRYANATTSYTCSNESVRHVVLFEWIVSLLSVFVVAARLKSKQTRVIRPDGEHFCQNADIQRGISAVRGFKVKAT